LGAGLQARHLGNVACAECGRAGFEDPPLWIWHSRQSKFNCSIEFLLYPIAPHERVSSPPDFL
jgi:hypothetical protein